MADASPDALHDAIMSCRAYREVRGQYLPLETGNKGNDEVRTAILDVLVEKESVRKGDILAEINKRGLTLSDSGYMRMMKELCESNKGGTWTMRKGDAMQS